MNLRVTSLVVLLIICGPAVALRSPVFAAQHNKTKKEALAWNPIDTDARLAGIVTTGDCLLVDATTKAGERALELVANLEQFDAVETTRQIEMEADGFAASTDDLTFDYSVEVIRGNGTFGMRESRTELKPSGGNETKVRDSGLAALAVIFHPIYQADFEMNCDGWMNWEGQPAWVISFRQRKDRPSRILSVRDDKGQYGIALKGRAWIAKDSGQMIRLETNLESEIRPIKLRLNSIAVDYAPVRFQSKNVELWLPQRVEAYSDYTDRRFASRHTYSDFKLFSVDTQAVIEQPKVPAAGPAPPPKP